jgi:2-oxo-4-hydroxy-4-carboxy-5-ureidoimidazoline decarboxylase
MSKLDSFNDFPNEAARATLSDVCAAPGWVGLMVEGRPYLSLEAFLGASDDAVAGLSVAELESALDGHPRIGERAGGRSGQEQAGVADAEEEVRRGLAEGNAEYEGRFGHIYLVCASGRSGAELLEVLRGRLRNDPESEWDVVREELAKINRLRLAKLLDQPAP